MRRPTGPAQRTPPQRPAQRPATEPHDERETPAAVSAPERPAAARVAEPRRDGREAAGRPETIGGRESAGGRVHDEAEPRTDASTSAPSSRFGTWRTVRRAANERRRIERTEARRFTARTRRRRQIQLACAAFVVVVIGGAVGAAYSPLMALKHIDVVGANSVKASQVQQALATELGKPLPLVSNADIRHALDDFRLIQSYSTEREPPGTLVVRITERAPLAVVKSGSSFELVDQAGVVLAAASTQQSGYPLVTLAAGQQPASSPSYAAAASVLAALPSAVRSRVTAIAATTPNDVTLTLTGGKTVVWSGTDQLQVKTNDLNALLKGAPSATTYDVSSPEAPITR